MGTAQYSFSRTRFGASASGSIGARHSQVSNGLQPAYGLVRPRGPNSPGARVTVAETSSFQPFLSYSFHTDCSAGHFAGIVAPAYESAIAPQNEDTHLFSAQLSKPDLSFDDQLWRWL